MFSELKNNYITLCKEFTDIQKKLREKDNEREDVLTRIRELQKNNPNLINSENKDINLESSKKEKKKSSDKQHNLIDRYKANDVKKNIIRKPLRDTDMETDDSESEEISDTETESDSDKCSDSN